MELLERDFRELSLEHAALMRDYGRAQVRCSEQLREQAATINTLEEQSMRLRAAVIVRDTALAWAREDRELLERSIPGLPRRVTLARKVEELLERVRDLMRERLHWEPRPQGIRIPSVELAGDEFVAAADGTEELEASLEAADLVICQTGCLSHGAYWRVQDHCRRTGKACVLVEQADALRIVRLHAASDDGAARFVSSSSGTPE